MHILLVEDNPSDVRLLKELMEGERYAPTIDWVIDGHEALDYVLQRNQHARASRPDVVLLDLGLPRISGYDVLKELKEMQGFSGIPVVILTTSRNPLDKNQCQALGADAFISKPRNLQEYQYLVRQMLREDFPRLVRAA